MNEITKSKREDNQSLLKQVEHDFIKDSDPIIQELKKNFWENKEALKVLFKELEQNNKYLEDLYLNDQLADDLEDIQYTLLDKIAKLLMGELRYHPSDTGSDSYFGYGIYTQVSYPKYFHDIDSSEADYTLGFMNDDLKIYINHREFIIHEIDTDNEEKIQYIREWLDWEEEYRTITCPE